VSEAERRRQAALAGHGGDEPTARAALLDPAPEVRATALGALERLTALNAADLAAALDDESVVVRRRACEAAALIPGDRPPSLLKVLASPDATVVEVAAWAAGERQPPEPGTLDVLIRLATAHDDALVREAAVASLGSIGDEAGLPAILAATQDKATVRRRAVIALAPFDGLEVEAALERARADRDWQVRQAAEDLS
jgi:HEAT repeat protein